MQAIQMADNLYVRGDIDEGDPNFSLISRHMVARIAYIVAITKAIDNSKKASN
jgi:hypothetical protein